MLAGISPGPARVPMVSAMTGEVLAGPELDAGYWYESLRAPVEFDRAVRVLAGTGHGVFVEVSPHPVLTAAVTETLEDAERAAGGLAPVVTGTLRRDDGGPDRFLASLAAVHVRGATVDWAAVLGGGERVDLPTYAFQRQRFWPAPAVVPAGGVAALGLGVTGHPLLGAAVELAGGQGLVLTGRLSVRSQPWLADHAVAGQVLLPGTAFVEMAVRAGTRRLRQVAELVLRRRWCCPPRAGSRCRWWWAARMSRAADRGGAMPGPNRLGAGSVDPARQRAAGPSRRAGRRADG